MKSGRVHLTLEWVPTASEAQSLDQVGIVYIRYRQISCKWLIDRFCSVSSGSSVPFQTVLPKQGGSVCSLTVCLGWASKRPTGESSHVTLMKQAVHVCCTFTYYPLLCLKLKKSGKEPKVGAEVTLGKLSQKTTVRHQSSLKGIIYFVEVKSILSFWRWVIGPLPLSGTRLSVSQFKTPKRTF